MVAPKTDAQWYVSKVQEAMVLTPKQEILLRSIFALALAEGQKQENSDGPNNTSDNQD